MGAGKAWWTQDLGIDYYFIVLLKNEMNDCDLVTVRYYVVIYNMILFTMHQLQG